MKRNLRHVRTALALAWAASAYAGAPELINMQGRLLDGSGNPVADGPYTVSFTVYDAASGGTALWAETTAVTATDGLFTVLLGNLHPVPDSVFASPDRWLGIRVASDPEMVPRQRLASVAYGLRVNTVDGATGGTITSKVSIGPGHTNTGVHAFVAGANNKARGDYSVIGGGGGPNPADSNLAVGGYSTVAGGTKNVAGFNEFTLWGTVGGGVGNVAGNHGSTVGGGGGNTASGSWATVPGGSNNTALGIASFAAGTNAKALYEGSFVWSGSYTGDFASTTFDQFLIRASGVGINTNAPAVDLHIKGNAGMLRLEGTNHSFMEFYPVGSGLRGGYFGFPASGSSVISLTNELLGGHIVLIPGSSGNVGVGIATPAFKLDVAGAAHATSFPTSSDSRLKKAVRPLSGVLPKLEKIRGVSFDWNETYENMGRSTGRREIGVIAEEVEAVFPELVSRWGEEEYRGVDYGRLTAVLIEAVKEQQRHIRAQNQKLEQLTATVAQLQSQISPSQAER